jgi:O-antigen/teichoic acid export membrane protein
MMTSKIEHSLLAIGALKGSAGMLVIKFSAAILGFAMFALASRQMDPAAFGSLAIIFNALSFLAVVALCGQETLIVRSWNEYSGTNRLALARGVLTFGASIVLGSALVTTLVTAFVWSAWDRNVSASLLVAACSFLLAQAFMHFSGQFARVAAGVTIGDVPRDAMWRLIVIAAIASHYVSGLSFGAAEFFFVSAGAIAVALVVQNWLVLRAIPAAVKRAHSERDVGTWIPRSFKMWLSAILDTTGQYLEVVVIGLFLGPTAAGFYFVATRITNGFAMISGSISDYATSRISGLYYSGARNELQVVLRTLGIVGAVLVCAALVMVIVTGKALLWMFGEPYVAAYPALLVLAAGASIGALAGPAPHVLLLTGHEGAYPRIMACGLVLRFLLIAALTPMYGLMGAAIAWAISAAAIGVALVFASCRLVGLDPSVRSAFVQAWPSVARLRRDAL